MRSIKGLATDLVRKPPMLFPFVALAHILWLLWTVWDDRSAPFPGIEWLQVLWLLGYTVSWLAVCDLKPWGAWGYATLTVVNVSLNIAVKNTNQRELYMSNLFIIDVLLCLFLLFYYKEFGRKR